MRNPSSITNIDIAAYALAALGGAERTVYSEDIAAKCYELAPSRFSWRREIYREKGWPDKYVVKTSLEDAKKQEYGSLVEGVYALDLSKDGWRLTAEGVRWFRDNRQRVESALRVTQPAIPRKDADRFRRHLNQQPLFKEFLKLRQVNAASVYSFTDMLNCSPDASPEVIAMKFRRMKTTAELVQDRDVSEFVLACEESFPQFSSGVKIEPAKEEQDAGQDEC